MVVVVARAVAGVACAVVGVAFVAIRAGESEGRFTAVGALDAAGLPGLREGFLPPAAAPATTTTTKPATSHEMTWTTSGRRLKRRHTPRDDPVGPGPGGVGGGDRR